MTRGRAGQILGAFGVNSAAWQVAPATTGSAGCGNSPAIGRPGTIPPRPHGDVGGLGSLCRHQLPGNQLDSGGGKTDRYHQHAKPIKTIWVYPLHKQYRVLLTATLETD